MLDMTCKRPYVKGVNVSISRQNTVAALLLPFRSSALVEATGCSRQTVHAWRTGALLPDVAALPELAALLNIDLGKFTQIVAMEQKQRRAERREVKRAS